jgi:nucleotide-binding universal stress UspA family protein
MKNKKINRILIPIDFSETGYLALEHGTFMAHLFKADLYLLHVIELIEFPFNLGLPLLFVPNSYEDIEKIVKVKLDELSRKISQRNDVHVVPLMSQGKVISGIRDATKDNNIDIIVMGTHGLKGFDEYFIGSNAHKTVTVSPCPTITVQTHAKNIGFKNIVMPIDNSLHSRQKVDLVIEG